MSSRQKPRGPRAAAACCSRPGRRGRSSARSRRTSGKRRRHGVASSRRRRRCRAPGSRARSRRVGALDRLQAGEQELPAVRVHYAVGELHRPKSSRMRVQIVDPPAYTPPYDRSLCAALARAGAEVELVTSRFAHGPVPAAEGYRVSESFYRRSAEAGPRRARPPGAEARRAPRRHAPPPPRRRARRRHPLPVADGAGARQPPACRRPAPGADGPRLAPRGGLAGASRPGAAPALGPDGRDRDPVGVRRRAPAGAGGNPRRAGPRDPARRLRLPDPACRTACRCRTSWPPSRAP